MARDRLSELWHTPIMPILFYVSAVTAGIAMTIIESLLTASAFRKKPEMHLLSELGGWLRYALGLYLALKIIDVLVRGALPLLFSSTAGLFFALELLIGVIAPLVMVLRAQVRGSRVLLFRAALLIIAGVILNRFNVLFFGQGGVFYAPSWQEFAVTAGITALGILVFMFAAKHFPVLDQHAH
jgi:Ni/Fe-hydrogenase subunit HybB-like protein